MRLSFTAILMTTLITSLVSAVDGLSVVQTYFIPFPDDEMLKTFHDCHPDAQTPITSIIAVSVAAAGTRIIWDHWEDGYEVDPSTPTQSTTAIWGDGNIANGAPPGVTTNAGDVLRGGQSIVIKNDVPIPRIASNLFFDGKDKVMSTYPIAISRSGYAGNSGPPMAGAVEVLNTRAWGTEHIAIVGENTNSRTDAFELSQLYVMAAYDGTTVTYPSVPGGSLTTSVINQGETLIVSVNQYEKVTSDKPVQVDFFCGDINAHYETRWYSISPRNAWTNEYYSPVAESFGNTGFWFYNPHTTTITITFNGGNLDNSGGTFTIPAGQTVYKQADTDSDFDITGVGHDGVSTTFRADYTGIQFTSSVPFYGLVQIDSDPKKIPVPPSLGSYSDGGQAWDWGFPLIPSNQLTPLSLVGLGFSCTDPKDCDRHRSYVFVTPVSNSYIFVDYNGDRIFDKSYKLDKLDALLLQDDSDYDMSGAIIAAFSSRTGGIDNSTSNVGTPGGDPVNIALAWGQNPASSQMDFRSQAREMDLGTAVLPLPNPWVSKRVVKVLNPDGTEDPLLVVDQTGDVIYYEITATNVGFGNVYGFTISDDLITNAGGILTGPLESVTTNGILEPMEQFTWRGTYAVASSDLTTATGTAKSNITNYATVTPSGSPPTTVDTFTPIKLAIISGTVTEDIKNDRVASNDTPLSNILVTLMDKNGNTVRTTLTDLSGFYQFTNVEAGDYNVVETNKASYFDVSDADGGTDLSSVKVFGVVGGQEYTKKDFVDEYLATRPPTASPTRLPTKNPTTTPTSAPTTAPTSLPTKNPTTAPTSAPTTAPTSLPTRNPTAAPTSAPTTAPTRLPTKNPTTAPTSAPTTAPTSLPTKNPTTAPTSAPTTAPTSLPTKNPTTAPTSAPTTAPTSLPTKNPTTAPTSAPTTAPTSLPTKNPTAAPTSAPTTTLTSPPTNNSTMPPTSPQSPDPTQDPTSAPTSPPSPGPTMPPTSPPSPDPTQDPTSAPTSPPSPGPTMPPTSPPSPDPTQDPTSAPTSPPSPGPTMPPTSPPNPDPTVPPSSEPSPAPTPPPSPSPTTSTTPGPSAAPSSKPSAAQSLVPSAIRSASPSEAPSKTGLFAITGNVMEDNNRDKIGDINLGNVAIALLDSNNVVIKTTLTDTSGNYKFDSLLPGTYVVKETNLAGYTDVTDSDGGDLNEIVVSIVSSNSAGNDFVDEQPSGAPSAGPSSVPSAIRSASPSEAPSKTGLFAITGNVMEDSNRDKIGDINLGNVAIALLDSNNVVIKTTLTDTSGNYKFDGLLPGTYVVKETNLDGYTDVTDSDGGDLNEIVVIIVSSNSAGNDFVDEQPSGAPSSGPSLVPSAISSASPSEAPSKTGLFAITGNVMEDNNRDKIGDITLGNVAIALLDSNNVVIKTTLTDTSGNYKFDGLLPGTYVVKETNIAGYTDVTDSDGGDLNEIVVSIVSSNSAGNDFVDEQPSGAPSAGPSSVPSAIRSASPSEAPSKTGLFAITGNVMEDNNRDKIGDFNLGNVAIALLDSNNVVIKTTLTDTSGNYKFDGLLPGTYVVKETNLDGYTDVTDSDGGDLNEIVVIIVSSNSAGNDFVDEQPSGAPSSGPSLVPSAISSASPSEAPSKTGLFAITGNVMEDNNRDKIGDINLGNVAIALLDSSNVVIKTTLTDTSGNYKFDGLLPGTYVVKETNIAGYTDVTDSDGGDLNEIVVSIVSSNSAGNDFVDEQPSGAPSSGPSLVPSAISSASPSEAPSKTGLFAITGNVMEDNNRDKIGDINLGNVAIALLDSSNVVIKTTLTDTSGNYKFDGLLPGTYVVKETNIAGYTDVTDSDGGDLNEIVVSIVSSNSAGNDFVDEQPSGAPSAGPSSVPSAISSASPSEAPSKTGLFAITGNVMEDNNRDKIGDINLGNVAIALLDSSNVVIKTTLTDTSGNYKFDGLLPGTYVVKETNIAGYTDVTDSDGGDLNEIVVSIVSSNSAGNDFVDEQPSGAPSAGPSSVPSAIRSASPSEAPSKTGLFAITGNVMEDNNRDKIGDFNLGNVAIALLDSNNVVIKTTLTDTSGNYKFDGLLPGTYVVKETNLDGYTDVKDSDGGDLNEIVVIIVSSNSAGNDFVDERLGQITGIVTNNASVKLPLGGAVITLMNDKGDVLATTVTTDNGQYSFTDLSAGSYSVVETNPADYPVDISGFDETNDNDPNDGTPSIDKNVISVTLIFGEVDDGNNFVDSRDPVESPSTAPSATPPSQYCEEMSFPGCAVCAPFRSTDFCDTTTSFPSLIQQRTSQFRNNPSELEVDGYWFHYLEDKIAAYLLTVDQLAPAPEIFCCETDVTQLYQCLEDKVFTKNLDGIVIKATNFHSNQGVFVLVNQTGTGQRSDPLFDLIQNLPTTYNDTMAALAHMQATKIIVEEFVGKRLPTEYKFHVVNGEIAAIDIIDGRDGDCPCYAVVDTAWNRLDKFGCFEPGGFELIDKTTGCTAIDFETGKRKAGPIKKDLYMCDQIPKISDCLLDEMVGIALALGNRIGVYMRVDMFVVDNAVYVQEYSANHMNGLRHCAAKTDVNGCVDSCFMGRLWNDAGAPFGGVSTPVPSQLVGFDALTPAQQCSLITNTVAPQHVSKCSLP